jgi:hypothetical protein
VYVLDVVDVVYVQTAISTRARPWQEERLHKKAQYAERARDEREHAQSLQNAVKAAMLGGELRPWLHMLGVEPRLCCTC